jgi:hypothetical protein
VTELEDVNPEHSRPADVDPGAERVHSRADLLPEEQAVGSDDPELQAEVILEDSDKRTADPEDAAVESKQSPTE